ncbi:MAG: FadR family transcriptional regulator [Alphaproteobacteria bacterium]|nr:FadR family transcriptional regulator [Alphaproteobacteria bacterium]
MTDPFALLNRDDSKLGSASDFGGGTLERQSISEQVANRIMGMIKSGNLKSGDQLPTEQQMCVAFGISRPPLREALKALTLMGVLRSRQGGRYTVTDLSTSRLVAPFNTMLSVTDYKVEEHFEARAVVDLELVRFCTERASDEIRARIDKLAKDGRAFHDDPVAFRLLDIEFHQAINRGAGNELLAGLAMGLYDVALNVRRVASEAPGVIEKSVEQHCAVSAAILEGDADGAVAAYRDHLDHIRETTIQASATVNR